MVKKVNVYRGLQDFACNTLHTQCGIICYITFRLRGKEWIFTAVVRMQCHSCHNFVENCVFS